MYLTLLIGGGLSCLVLLLTAFNDEHNNILPHVLALDFANQIKDTLANEPNQARIMIHRIANQQYTNKMYPVNSICPSAWILIYAILHPSIATGGVKHFRAIESNPCNLRATSVKEIIGSGVGSEKR